MNVNGRIVLVTGGAGGIGTAMVDRFLAERCRVVVCGRTEATLAALAATRDCVDHVACDIAEAGGRTRLREALEERFGRLDILVNNAGIHVPHDFRDGAVDPMARAAAIDRELAINLAAPIHLSAELLPLLRAGAEAGGNAGIVNISSTLAVVPKRTAPIYCATKAGLHAFSIALRGQFEGTPIRVFSVLVPQVETPMTAGRGTRKMPAARFCDILIEGLRNDVLEMCPGISRRLVALHGTNPRAAELVVRRMTEPRRPRIPTANREGASS